MLAMVGASAALEISDIPFAGPIANVRVGRIDGQFVANPTLAQWAESDINIIVAGSRTGRGHGGRRRRCGQRNGHAGGHFLRPPGHPTPDRHPGRTQGLHGPPPSVLLPRRKRIRRWWTGWPKWPAPLLREALTIPEKMKRYEAVRAAKAQVVESLGEESGRPRRRSRRHSRRPAEADLPGYDSERRPAGSITALSTKSVPSVPVRWAFCRVPTAARCLRAAKPRCWGF